MIADGRYMSDFVRGDDLSFVHGTYHSGRSISLGTFCLSSSGQRASTRARSLLARRTDLTSGSVSVEERASEECSLTADLPGITATFVAAAVSLSLSPCPFSP